MKKTHFIITEETKIATRLWFAKNCIDCIDEAKSGILKINNLDKYISDNISEAKHYIDGKYDQTLSFIQRAEFLQTGKCTPILPPIE